jgi:hypothetical protein
VSEANGRRPLFAVKGDATAEEVAALTVAIQAVAAASAAADTAPEVSGEWAAHHRKLRGTYPAGPGRWRSSGLPR